MVSRSASTTGWLVGLDLFDSAETLERQWPRLVGSAASALLDRQRAIQFGAAPMPKHRHVDAGALGRMLERATSALADANVAHSVGLGHDVRFSAPKLVGTALVHDRRAVHVALFRPA
ncbi:MAG: ARPP-1 family domain-containing protein [Candidatus Limnocylindrales bacterium]